MTASSVKGDAYGAGGRSEDLGDLLVREVEPVLQDDRGALSRAQRAQRARCIA